MGKEKSIVTVLILSLFALFFLGARAYYAHDGHMTMRGMHGSYNTGHTENYGMHGYGMMGAGMMNFGHGMMETGMGCSIMGSTGIVDYYLYNRDELNLSEKQVTTLTDIRDKYYKETLALRTELYEKNFELEKLLYEEKFNLSEVKSITNEIGTIESKIRYNGIESFTKARNALTGEQINKLSTETFRGHMR
jgi:Spy/CpxP family protein refolding chaperone